MLDVGQSTDLAVASAGCVLTCNWGFGFENGVDASHSIRNLCGYLEENVVPDLAPGGFTVTAHRCGRLNRVLFAVQMMWLGAS